MVYVLLKPGLENFEHYFVSVWDVCNCAIVLAFFGSAFFWDWDENWPFPVLWPLQSFPNLLAYWVHTEHGPYHQNRTVSPSVCLSCQETSISLLSFSIRGQTDWKPHRKLTSLITWTTVLPIQWNYEPCHVGSPKMDGLWWRGLVESCPLEEGMANHFTILALRTSWTV